MINLPDGPYRRRRHSSGLRKRLGRDRLFGLGASRRDRASGTSLCSDANNMPNTLYVHPSLAVRQASSRATANMLVLPLKSIACCRAWRTTRLGWNYKVGHVASEHNEISDTVSRLEAPSPTPIPAQTLAKDKRVLAPPAPSIWKINHTLAKASCEEMAMLLLTSFSSPGGDVRLLLQVHAAAQAPFWSPAISSSRAT